MIAPHPGTVAKLGRAEAALACGSGERACMHRPGPDSGRQRKPVFRNPPCLLLPGDPREQFLDAPRAIVSRTVGSRGNP